MHKSEYNMKIKRIFKKILKSRMLTAILSLAIIVAIVIIVSYNGNNNEEEVQEEAKPVSVEKVISSGHRGALIKTVGKVMPVNSVDVVALAQGKIEGLFFEIGDEVEKNQNLAFLSNNMSSTNLNTAKVSYLNMLSNLDIIRRSADEQVRQAEIGVDNASESVNLAQLSLDSALDSLDNSGEIQAKNNEDIKENAVIAYDDYLNIIKGTLDDVNYIIAAEIGEQLAGIKESLAAKNSQTLVVAKDDYRLAKLEYTKLTGIKPTTDNVLLYLNKISGLVSLVNKVVASTITVLDNTTENQSFSEGALITQRDAYLGVLNSVVGAQTRVQASINNLEGLSLNDEKLANSLKIAVDSAESQLATAKVAYDNSLVNLERAKQAKEQQILSAQMSIDSSLGQLNLNRDQFSDLILKAPISGRITKKAVDMGTEASPGQLIAQVSQTNELKIEINLSSEDAYLVETGQKVIINDKYEAEISSINPVADEITRKVKAEIRFDNKDNDLIPGTTVDIEIPSTEEKIEETVFDSIFIPIKAVNINQIENFVFVAEENKAKKALVEIGKQKGNLIEILSGLKTGDMLIVDGGRILEDGDRIDIK